MRGVVVLIELLEGLDELVGLFSTLAALVGLDAADGVTFPFLLLVTFSPADEGRLLLLATCNPPPPGLGPLGFKPPPPG